MFKLFSLIVLKFSVFRSSAFPNCLRAFDAGKKIEFSKTTPQHYQLTFSLRSNLSSQNSQNWLLRPFSTFFDAVDMKFEFPGCFNAQLNIFLSTNRHHPTETFVLNKYITHLLCVKI